MSSSCSWYCRRSSTPASLCFNASRSIQATSEWMQTSASSDIRPNTFCGDSCCRCRYWLCGYLVLSFWFCCISSKTEDGWTARLSRSTSTSFTSDIETNAFTGSSSILSRSSWSYRWTCFCRRSRSLTKAWQQSSRCLCWSDCKCIWSPTNLKSTTRSRTRRWLLLVLRCMEACCFSKASRK